MNLDHYNSDMWQRKHFCLRNVSLTLLCIGLVLTPISRSFASGLTISQFTNLVINPPRFDTLLFKQIAPPSYAFKDEKQANDFLLKVKKNPELMAPKTQIFALRFSPTLDGFISREVESFDDPWNPTNARLTGFYGRLGTNWWNVQQKGATFIESKDGTFVDSGKTNRFYFLKSRICTQILRLGMFELIPESFKMVNDLEFSGDDDEGSSISGKFIIDNAGVVQGLEYNAGERANRLIQFYYSNNFDCQFPSRIEIYSLQASAVKNEAEKKLLICTYEIVKCLVGTNDLAPSDFLPDQFLKKDEPRITTDEKGNNVLVFGTNRTVLKPEFSSDTPNSSNRTLIIRIVLACLFF